MKIAHIANFYGPGSGGVRTFMHTLARGYAEAGHEMVMIVPGAEQADEYVHNARRITVPGRRIVWSGGYRMITDLKLLRQLLLGIDPDRLEVSDRLTLRSLGTWARSRGVPAACIVHERLDGVLRAHGRMPAVAAQRIADRHNRGTAESFDTLVATTEFAAAEFSRIGRHDQVQRIPLGVDLTMFDLTNYDPRVRAGYLDSPHDEVLLVMCSRLSKEKRPDLAINALRLIRQRGVRARLVVVGSGPAAIERRVRILATGLPVVFTGFIPDRPMLASLLASADLVIAPGPIETFGLAALEALASGTPVVGSSTSALAEIVTEDAGAVADPDPSALADAVCSVLERDEHGRRAAARARAVQFSWQTTIDRFMALPSRAGHVSRS